MAIRQSTFWIEESIHNEIRAVAFCTGRTIKEIVTQAIVEYLRKLKDVPATDGRSRRNTG